MLYIEYWILNIEVSLTPSISSASVITEQWISQGRTSLDPDTLDIILFIHSNAYNITIHQFTIHLLLLVLSFQELISYSLHSF